MMRKQGAPIAAGQRIAASTSAFSDNSRAHAISHVAPRSIDVQIALPPWKGFLGIAGDGKGCVREPIAGFVGIRGFGCLELGSKGVLSL